MIYIYLTVKIVLKRMIFLARSVIWLFDYYCLVIADFWNFFLDKRAEEFND